MIQTYLADVTPLYEEDVYARYFDRIPQWRREKAQRMKFAAGKAQSVGAWALLEKVRELHGLGEETLYNLSHSGPYALCTIDDTGGECVELGCDVEMMGELNLNIANRFYTKNEYNKITSKETKELQTDLFFRYWVLKESFMKATRRGMALDTRSFEITFDEADCPILARQPEEFSKPYYYKEYSCSGVDAKIAVCATTMEFADNLEIIIL